MKRLYRALAWALAAACSLSFVFLALDWLFPFPVERLAPPASTVVTGSRGEPIRFFLARDQSWRFPVALDDIPAVYLDALLCAEDRRFFRHPGVDPAALAKALAANVLAGRVVRGGSTITMQVARLAEPKPRTYAAKIIECFRAFQLELHFSKPEILRCYANLAPFGGNITGLGAASWFYFGKSPDKLSLSEAALLAAIPRSPNRFQPVRHPHEARKARTLVLAAMAATGAAAPERAAEAAAQPLPGALKRPPLIAPHLAQMAVAQARAGAAPPARTHGGSDTLPALQTPAGASAIRTTLDSRIQEISRQAARSRLVELRAQGVGNAAVVVLDVKTRDVLALVGSDDFLDESRRGKVNAATAQRSPGSALKPFLYALAFQDGDISPQSLLLDIPITAGNYDPRNYDGNYRGRVEAQDALINSYNTPAVRLLAQAGPERFHKLLLDGGLAGLSRPTAHYGLALILGGGEVSLLDLTNLYATLARGGMHAPASFLTGVRHPEKRLLSPEACSLSASILSRLERPDLPGGAERASGLPTVAWKTGTSFGHRDAFAVGFSSRFVVGVWTGNVDGRPVKGISGMRQAAPLFFDIFRALEPDGSGLPRPEGLNLAEVEVCALSRQLPGPDCRERVAMTVIPGVTKLTPCLVHQRVLVDAATGLRVAGSCLDGRDVRQEVVTQYPAELTTWWRAGGMPVPAIPEPSPDCPEALAGQGPRITSPKAQAVYRLRPGSPEAFQRVGLAAQAGTDAGELHWFQDGILVREQGQGEGLFLELERGEHRLMVVDSRGRSDSVRFSVE
ncbi:penicillin-binding protein 1C [Fundidesulfovibrio terrae]|uniref:penicillin-binding protein 1C n=1 Tax=Fundidesulfovibrio terrae TaxID=2922866 RepID=UPI001FB026F5